MRNKEAGDGVLNRQLGGRNFEGKVQGREVAVTDGTQRNCSSEVSSCLKNKHKHKNKKGEKKVVA